jgi:DNA-binding phage protein
VFLTFVDAKSGLAACRASAGKAGNLSDVAKKAGISNKAGISFCPKIVDLSLKN